MPHTSTRRWVNKAVKSSKQIAYPVLLALLPAVLFGLNWYFGEAALLIAAVALPAVAFGTWLTRSHAASAQQIMRKVDGDLIHAHDFSAIVSGVFEIVSAKRGHSAVLSIEVDGHDNLLRLYGRAGCAVIVKAVGKRLTSVLRENDAVSQTGDFLFSVCLEPVRDLDLEICIQLAGRIQTAIEEPIALDGTTVYVSTCIGLAQFGEAHIASPVLWQESAKLAMTEAQRHGAGTLRAFSEPMRQQSQSRAALQQDIASALSSGDIVAWFQPQISTDTGQISGFEALARWQHPDKGLVPPGEFLDLIAQSNLLERLAEVMMFNAFKALKAWDLEGLDVPQVGINFAGPELNNPHLTEKISWELDRFELKPERLTVEILETVVSESADDVVSRNIRKLKDMGCKIDLDDFGTGYTSITSIRRFAVDRIKIDRSFVAKSDRDPEQQRVISAILTMAERMNIGTLAEGVETVGEHAVLSQLGCNHVQGYGIARPMPFNETIDWMKTHNAKLRSTRQMMGKTMKRP